MSDIKMSDAFILPVKRVEGGVLPMLYDNQNQLVFVSNADHVDAAAIAINAHDKLTEQNNLLREALNSIVNGENSPLILDWAICGIHTNSSSGPEGRAARMKSYHDFHLDWCKAKCLIEQDSE